jgi:hypothetical protein
MKSNSIITGLGKRLMRAGRIRIAVADDEATYFNSNMLSLADKAGYGKIERHLVVDQALLDSWLTKPPEILVLDIKGVCTADVAKDGIELANLLIRETPSMVVITSAHKYHLRGAIISVDHIIERRNLTAVDFINELSVIVDKYLSKKAKFYKHILFRAGFALAKGALP